VLKIKGGRWLFPRSYTLSIEYSSIEYRILTEITEVVVVVTIRGLVVEASRRTPQLEIASKVGRKGRLLLSMLAVTARGPNRESRSRAPRALGSRRR
jgi:hypothetical protein